MNQLKSILVGVDFSECSRCALEQAVRLARWNEASLSVIHGAAVLVVRPPAASGGTSPAGNTGQ